MLKKFAETATDGNMIKAIDLEVEDSPETKAMLAEAEDINKQSKESAQRALQKIKETEELAIATTDKLKQQGEQLKRTADGNDMVEDNLNLAERELKTIGSLFGQIENAIFKHKHKPSNTNAEVDAQLAKEAKEKEKHSKKEKGKKGTEHPHDHNTTTSSNTPKEIQILSKEAQQDYKETEDTLDEIGKAATNLKSIAQGMGSEIDEQNKRLDIINEKIEKNNLRIRADQHKKKFKE